jgi:UDP-GlcNAc3NAcA epimerase
MNILAIIGARPQFIKHVSFLKYQDLKFSIKTLHTGQHFDQNMSNVFFDDFDIAKPEFNLSISGGSHGEQTGKMIIEIEKVILSEKPKAVLLYGDTNSTLAGAVAASKLSVPIIHIEAGLRSYNREMPEEINRVITDCLSQLLFAPNSQARDNLRSEGITGKIFVSGDIMKDLVLSLTERIDRNSVEGSPYYYATIHRPYNTDSKLRLEKILSSLNRLDKKVVFPMHPRTSIAVERYGLSKEHYSNINFIQPQSYKDNLEFLCRSSGLITDSGGMQKEAYWLQKRCITIRKETEWPETLKFGWNHLCFENLESMNQMLQSPLGPWNTRLYGDVNIIKSIMEQIDNFLGF